MSALPIPSPLGQFDANTSPLAPWYQAFRAYYEGRPEELAALVRRGNIPVEVREQLARCLLTGPPKPVSKRTKRLTDAAIEVLELIAAGETPHVAIEVVCSKYGDIDESVLDNAALGGCRSDVNAEKRRRGWPGTTPRSRRTKFSKAVVTRRGISEY